MLFNDEEKFNDEFARACAETGVPVALAKAFVALESAFNPRSYRYEPHINDASYGLAQTLLGTARRTGYVGEGEGLYDPYTSLLHGCKFIRLLASKYPLADELVAAYNMGWPRPISRTTPLIANIYRYPLEYATKPPTGWKFANEPYCRRVLSYLAYYQEKETGYGPKAKAIEALIKAKNLEEAYKMYKPVVYAQPIAPRLKVCPTCQRPI